jgi:hypothetical protein
LKNARAAVGDPLLAFIADIGRTAFQKNASLQIVRTLISKLLADAHRELNAPISVLVLSG